MASHTIPRGIAPALGAAVLGLVLGAAIGYSWWIGAAFLGLAAGAGLATLSVANPPAMLMAAILIIAFGQVGRIPPLSGSMPVLDLFVAAFAFFGALAALSRRRRLPATPVHTLWAAFLAVSLLALLLTPLSLSTTELAKDSLYWLRLLAYGSVIWLVPALADEGWSSRIYAALVWTGMAVVAIGFLQLALYPDIGPLAKYGWDPHIGRLVSSFLDPNYLGGFFAIILALLFGSYLGNRSGRLPWLAAGLVVVASVLTYSRSGYLAVAAVIFLFGLRYSWKLLLLALAIVMPLALSIPRVQQRVAGGFAVDGTSQARIASWNNALEVIRAFPVTGIGYNAYDNAQEDLGIIPRGTEGHSVNGSDSSLLNVQATTGAVGFALFLATVLVLLRHCLRVAEGGRSRTARSAAYAMLFMTPALLIHSFFVNGLFYPFLLLPIMVTAGLALTGENSRRD